MIRKVYQQDSEVKKLKIDYALEYLLATSAAWDGIQASAKKSKERESI
jgi:hypothetical protein